MSDTRPSGGLPPIVRDAQRLLLAVEQCVRNFPRYHKYQIGSDLRRQAMEIARSANRAWRDRAQQLAHVQRLVWQTDDMKLSLQLAKTVQAFASFSQFEACARLARKFHHDSARRAQNRDGWLRDATTRGRVPSGRSNVQSDARVWDATGAEPFCCVQVGFEQSRSLSKGEGTQNGVHGEISGLMHLIALQAGGWSRKLATSEPKVHSASSSSPPFSPQNGQKHAEPRAYKQSFGQYAHPDSLSPADTPEVKA